MIRFKTGLLLSLYLAFSEIFVNPCAFGQTKATPNANNLPPVVVGCQCFKNVDVPVKAADGKTFKYYPLLRDVTSYKDMLNMGGWVLDGGEKVYNRFSTDTNFMDRNSDALQTSFSIISNSPFKFTHPDNTFGVNLTPCISVPTKFRLSVDVNYREALYVWGREKFDTTARAYLHVILKNTNNEPATVLNTLLDEMIEGNQKAGVLKLNKLIDQTNKKYGTKIEKINGAKFNSDEVFTAFIKHVKERADLETYVNNEFIATPGKSHHIDENEKAILGALFKCDMDHFDQDFLKSQYAAFFKINYLGFDIANTTLRQWDESKNIPVKDGTGNFVPAAILADVSKVESSTTDGLKMNIKNIFFSPAEIAGTGIIINFNKAQVISTQDDNNENLSYEYYPQFIIPSPVAKTNKNQVSGDDDIDDEVLFDDLLTKFTGLSVDTAEAHFNYKGKTINAPIEDLLINNKVIAGRIDLSIKTSVKSNTITVKSGNQLINTTLTDLKNYFIMNNLSKVELTNTGSNLWITFKKLSK